MKTNERFTATDCQIVSSIVYPVNIKGLRNYLLNFSLK